VRLKGKYAGSVFFKYDTNLCTESMQLLLMSNFGLCCDCYEPSAIIGDEMISD
jgi:hypothetical protein